MARGRRREEEEDSSAEEISPYRASRAADLYRGLSYFCRASALNEGSKRRVKNHVAACHHKQYIGGSSSTLVATLALAAAPLIISVARDTRGATNTIA